MKLHAIKSQRKQFSCFKTERSSCKNFHLYDSEISDKHRQYIGYVS